ncbi:MAG: hypothetical protein JXP34_00630 [Planctomycetes bacterium]|nr:hypothetical protein [Planctomycetota bacterium]
MAMTKIALFPLIVFFPIVILTLITVTIVVLVLLLKKKQPPAAHPRGPIPAMVPPSPAAPPRPARPYVPPYPAPRPRSSGTPVVLIVLGVLAAIGIFLIAAVFMIMPARVVPLRETRVASPTVAVRRIDSRSAPPLPDETSGVNVEEVPAEQAIVVSPPRSIVDVPDYLAKWKEGDAIAPPEGAKPWIEDAAGAERWSGAVGDLRVTCRRPGPSGELVGYSSFEPSPEEARAQAIDRAGEDLDALAAAELKRQDPAQDIEAAMPLIREVVRNESERWAQGSEYYEQTVRRPYGTVYRAAVRIRATADEVIRPIVERVRAEIRSGWIEARARRKEIFWTGISIAALVVSIFLLYSFANAGTKGHFAWPLRLVSALAFGGLCLGILYLRGWIA